MSTPNYNQRSKALILVLMLPIMAFVIFFGIFFPGFELLIPIIIPIIFLIAIGIIIIRFSWNPQPHCSRCNYPVSIYAEFCRNCGLKLISKCPNCNNFIREGFSRCTICGHSIEIKEQQREEEQYEIIQKDTSLPLRPNFCPTCGTSLKNVENIRFCEYCGSRIK